MARPPAKRHGRGIVPRRRPRRERRSVLPRRRLSSQMVRAKREAEKRIAGGTRSIERGIHILGEIQAQNNQWGLTLVLPRLHFPGPEMRNTPVWQAWFHVPGIRTQKEAKRKKKVIGSPVIRSSRTMSYVAMAIFDSLGEALSWLEEKGPKYNKLIKTKNSK